MNGKVDWYIHLDRVQFYILQKAAICHCFCEINDVEKIVFFVFFCEIAWNYASIVWKLLEGHGL